MSLAERRCSEDESHDSGRLFGVVEPRNGGGAAVDEHEDRPGGAVAPCLGDGLAARCPWHSAEFLQHRAPHLQGAECRSACKSVGRAGQDTCAKEHSGASHHGTLHAVVPPSAHSAPHAPGHQAAEGAADVVAWHAAESGRWEGNDGR